MYSDEQRPVGRRTTAGRRTRTGAGGASSDVDVSSSGGERRCRRRRPEIGSGRDAPPRRLRLTCPTCGGRPTSSSNRRGVGRAETDRQNARLSDPGTSRTALSTIDEAIFIAPRRRVMVGLVINRLRH